LLKETLKKYKQLDSSNSWKSIDTKGKLALHDESKDVASLRKRLFELGDLKFDSGSEIFDE